MILCGVPSPASIWHTTKWTWVHERWSAWSCEYPWPTEYVLSKLSTNILMLVPPDVPLVWSPVDSYVESASTHSKKHISDVIRGPRLLEEHSEYVLWVEIVSEKASLALESLPILLLWPKLIIVLSLLWVTETCKCLTNLFKSLTCRGSLVLIRVYFQSQL